MKRQWLTQLLDVPSIDVEDARRRKLLNIMLAGIVAITLVAVFVSTVVLILTPNEPHDGVELFYIGGAVVLVGAVIIYLINRYQSGWVASTLFLIFLSLVFAFSDIPLEVVNGRTLFMFAIPVIMASVLLRPYASFLMAGFVGILVTLVAVSANLVPSIPSLFGFFAIALVSWMSARSLERALQDLRTINRDLDRRVVERTRDLAEALLRVQAESSKNQAILEGIADGVIVFDDDGKAIVANPAIARLLGRTTQELTGQHVEDLMAEHVYPEDRSLILNLLKGEVTYTPGTKLQWGSKVLSVSFAAVRDAMNHSIGMVGVFRDFTREAELDRMKNAFVSMASHELRTPLNAILGYSDMLKEEVFGALNPDQLDTTSRITANAQRMLSLVNNLLDRAQMEAGKLSINTTEFSPSQLIYEFESMMGVLARNKGLQLDSMISANVPPMVTGDPQRLQQILVNLAGNAIKFTEKGRVHLRVYCPQEDQWALEVSDTGPGIPSHAQAYIFDPFRQVDDSITREHAGSGLGLSIVKQLTELMGGEIRLMSEVGRGSTFTVILPLSLVKEVV
jgi:PAS domain S-box-containing protein